MVETTEEYRNRINQLKTSIENEPYIQKMREDIAEGISKTGNRQADIEEQFQEVIDNTTGKDVISAPELIAARNGEVNLKARLDKERQEVAAQLTQTATKTELNEAVEPKANQAFVDAQLAQISGGPKGTFSTLAALKAAYPTEQSGWFLVLENNHRYTWSKTANDWVDNGAFERDALTNYDRKYIGNGQYFSIEDSPISSGYKRFLDIPFESGSINYANGADIPGESSIRTPIMNKVKFFYSDITILNKNNTLYRYRIIEFNPTESFISTSNWFTDESKKITINNANLFRFEVQRIGGSNISFNDAFLNFKVAYQIETTENFDTLNKKTLANKELTKGRAIDFDETPFRYGFNKELLFDFEQGSISSSNGNDINTSLDSIRTKKANMIRLSDNLTVINLNKSLLRIKAIKYDDSGVLTNAGLWINADKETINIDKNSYYRFQISSTDGTAIDLTQLKNIHIFYQEDKYSGLPNYWQTYLDERIKYIRKLMQTGPDLTTFITTTDTHYTPNNVNDINANVPKYLADKLNIDTFVHLGDFSSENPSKDVAVDYLEHVNKEYKKVTDNYLAIRGNHDDNNEGNKERTFDKVITQKESYQWIFNRMNNVVFGETGTYYYFDKPFEKVRIIGLDCIDFVYQQGTDGYIAEKRLSWGFKQLEWFANIALNVPEGYQIIILNHAGITDTKVTKEVGISQSKQTKPLNTEDLLDILEGFKNKELFSKEISLSSTVDSSYFSGSLTVDFSEYKGEIIGVFSGHEHIDDIQDIELSGYKNIFTLNNSVNFPTNIPSYAYQPTRNVFTVTEEVYDVVIVNRKTRLVKMVRIGAGLEPEREFSY